MMDTAIPVYFELDTGVDHDAIERELDAQMGLAPRPPRWKPTGPPLCCQHTQIDRVQLKGRAVVTCLTCSHEWFEYPIEAA
jgi:hypothetical protein